MVNSSSTLSIRRRVFVSESSLSSHSASVIDPTNTAQTSSRTCHGSTGHSSPLACASRSSPRTTSMNSFRPSTLIPASSRGSIQFQKDRHPIVSWVWGWIRQHARIDWERHHRSETLPGRICRGAIRCDVRAGDVADPCQIGNKHSRLGREALRNRLVRRAGQFGHEFERDVRQASVEQQVGRNAENLVVLKRARAASFSWSRSQPFGDPIPGCVRGNSTSEF